MDVADRYWKYLWFKYASVWLLEGLFIGLLFQVVIRITYCHNKEVRSLFVPSKKARLLTKTKDFLYESMYADGS